MIRRQELSSACLRPKLRLSINITREKVSLENSSESAPIESPTLCELMMANMVYGNWENLRQNFPTESCKNQERLGFVTSWQSKLFYLNWKTIHTSDLSRENIKRTLSWTFQSLVHSPRQKFDCLILLRVLQAEGKFPSDLMLPRIWHMKEVHLGAKTFEFAN